MQTPRYSGAAPALHSSSEARGRCLEAGIALPIAAIGTLDKRRHHFFNWSGDCPQKAGRATSEGSEVTRSLTLRIASSPASDDASLNRWIQANFSSSLISKVNH